MLLFVFPVVENSLVSISKVDSSHLFFTELAVWSWHFTVTKSRNYLLVEECTLVTGIPLPSVLPRINVSLSSILSLFFMLFATDCNLTIRRHFWFFFACYSPASSAGDFKIAGGGGRLMEKGRWVEMW